MKPWLPTAALLAFFVFPAAGQVVTVQPGAPGEPARLLKAGEGRAAAAPHAAADVVFMQGMIPHHAQALEMTALLPGRTETRAIRLIARRIEVAQHDEIRWMQRWLQERGAEVPEAGAHAHHLMPGMLTPEEMAHLAAARGATFDRLFLHYMIRHHEGALVMVRDLFAAEGAAQATEVYGFATDVDADQRAEIARMRGLLEAMPEAGTPLPAPAKHDH